jgi:hypothetical protein
LGLAVGEFVQRTVGGVEGLALTALDEVAMEHAEEPHD